MLVIHAHTVQPWEGRTMKLDAGVEVFAGNVIIIMQSGEDTYEIYRGTDTNDEPLQVRLSLCTEQDFLNVALYCAGLVSASDIADFED